MFGHHAPYTAYPGGALLIPVSTMELTEMNFPYILKQLRDELYAWGNKAVNAAGEVVEAGLDYSLLDADKIAASMAGDIPDDGCPKV